MLMVFTSFPLCIIHRHACFCIGNSYEINYYDNNKCVSNAQTLYHSMGMYTCASYEEKSDQVDGNWFMDDYYTYYYYPPAPSAPPATDDYNWFYANGYFIEQEHQTCNSKSDYALTTVSFNTQHVMKGVSPADLDTRARQAFLDVIAYAVSGVSSSDMAIVSITAAGGLSNEVKASTSATNIVFSITGILQVLGYKTSAEMAEDIQRQLRVTFSDPAIVQFWLDKCIAYGSLTITNATAVDFSVPDVDESSITSSTEGGESSSNDGDNDTITIIIGVVAGVVGVAALVGIVFMVVMRRKSSYNAANTETVVNVQNNPIVQL